MAQELEPLNLKITGNANGLSAALGKAQGDISGFTSSIQGKLAGLAPALTGLFAGVSGSAFGGFALKAAAEVEVVSAKFKALTGSAEGSKAVVKELRDLAAETPLSFEGVSKAATTLLAYNTPVEQLIPTLKLLGDVSLGDQEKLERLAIAFGQVQAKGKLMAQEVNQMVENGFNPLVEISRTTGLSMTELYKKMEAGEITFDMVVGAFKSATSEGGRFSGAMEAIAGTLTGKLTQLSDKFGQLAAKIGEALLPMAKEAVDGLTDMVQWLGSLDASTVETTAKIAAFSASFALAVTILPKLIAFGKELVVVIRSIATAQTVMQALAGPKGWATLAVGLAAAGAAVYGVDKLFDSLEESQKNAANATEKVANGMKEVGKQSDQAAQGLKEYQDKANALKETLATPEEKYKAKIEELSQAVLKGGLDFEFFSRGVRAAYEELERFNQQQVESSRPKFAIKGSKEAREILDKRAFDAKVNSQVESEVERLKRKIEEQKSNKPVDEMKTVLAAKLDNVANKLDGVIAAVNNSKPVVRTANI